MKTKGTISIPAVTVGGIIISVITGAAFYFTNVGAQNSSIADVKQTVAVHDVEIQAINKTLDSEEAHFTRLEDKIDALLLNQGIDPNKVLSKN